MNKYTIIVLLIFLSVLGMNGNNSEAGVQATPKSKEQIKKSVVKITSQGRQGTGFIVGLVSDTVYILTVSHVVASDPAPNVEFFGQPGEFKAKILEREQPENGFALLMVTGSIPSDAIPLYVNDKFVLEQGDSVFTFGFPLNAGDWAHDELSYSSRLAREILFSGSDIKEGNSGGPLINGDVVVGMVTSVMDFAHANSSVGIREFLQGANGGNIVLEQMEKWGVNWRKAYDKHLKEISMLAEQQRIAAEKAAAAKESESKQKQQLAEQQRIAVEKAAKEAENKQKQQLAEQQHTSVWQSTSDNTKYKVSVTPGMTPECKSAITEVYGNGQKRELIPIYICKQPDGTWKEEQIENATTDTPSDNYQKTGGIARFKRLGFGSFLSFPEGSTQVIPSLGLLEIKNALLNLEENASILIVGHTNNYEVDTYHTDLSILRAEAVRQWLEDNGVRKGAVQIKGEVLHLPSSKTESYRRQSRHVEFAAIYE